jgi:DNA-binding CsgD family transcriptional regulator/PAS domain-containing protein
MDWMTPTDQLIADLYETVLRPDQIPDVLARINALVDCDGLHLLGKDEDKGHVFASIVIGDRLKEAEHDYMAYYYTIDPRLTIGRSIPTGFCGACSDYLDQDFVRHSEFYQDLLIPHGLRYIIGGNVFREGPRNLHVVMNHGVGRPAFEGEKRQVIGRWMYHLSRWAAQLMHADQLRQAVSATSFGIETLGHGLLLLDDHALIRFANQAAVSILGEGLSGQGFRKTFRPGTELLALVRRVLLDRVARTVTLDHAVQGHRVRWVCSILPLPRERGVGGGVPAGLAGLPGASPAPGAPWTPEGASVVVLIRPEGGAPVPPRRLYAQSFGLTPAEARLAEALARHVAPKAYAEEVGVTLATVRTQIRALLAKTGAVNLRSLVALLASLPTSFP